MGLESAGGRTGGATGESGQIIRCMGLGFMNGLMDNLISENMSRISKAAMAYFYLAMADNIWDFGKVAKDMAWGSLYRKTKK